LIFKKKRCETEIIFDLLSAAKNDIKKTPLMYKTNMTYTRFMKYSKVLIEKGFLIKKNSNSNGKFYCISEDGEKLLESLNTILTYLN